MIVSRCQSRSPADFQKQSVLKFNKKFRHINGQKRNSTVSNALVDARLLHTALAPFTDIMVQFSVGKFVACQSFKACDRVASQRILIEIIQFAIEMINAALVGALLARYNKAKKH